MPRLGSDRAETGWLYYRLRVTGRVAAVGVVGRCLGGELHRASRRRPRSAVRCSGETGARSRRVPPNGTADVRHALCRAVEAVERFDRTTARAAGCVRTAADGGPKSRGKSRRAGVSMSEAFWFPPRTNLYTSGVKIVIPQLTTLSEALLQFTRTTGHVRTASAVPRRRVSRRVDTAGLHRLAACREYFEEVDRTGQLRSDHVIGNRVRAAGMNSSPRG